MFKIMATLLLILSVLSCSDEKTNSSSGKAKTGNSSVSLKLTDYKDYCMATMEKDHNFKHKFDEISVKKGEQLLVSYSVPFNEKNAQSSGTYDLLRFNANIPEDIRIKSEEGVVKSDCYDENTDLYIVALNEVKLYKDKNLKSLSCTLKKGTSKKVENEKGFSIGMMMTDVKIDSENVVYEVHFGDVYKQECPTDNKDNGYFTKISFLKNSQGSKVDAYYIAALRKKKT